MLVHSVAQSIIDTVVQVVVTDMHRTLGLLAELSTARGGKIIKPAAVVVLIVYHVSFCGNNPIENNYNTTATTAVNC